MNQDFLTQIINKKKESIKKLQLDLSTGEISKQIANAPYEHRFFKQALNKTSRIGLVAEIKKASPSKGIIRGDFDPVKIAKIYQESGADAVSILTEEDYFKGSITHIEQIRREAGLPILRKDFIIDEYQIYESRLIGADAILLIAKLLSDTQLDEYLQRAKTLDLECLVEIHDEDDLEKVLNNDAQIIGINNRNLKTFELDLSISERLIPMIPKTKTIVVESGIKTKNDIDRLKGLNLNAVLIGEAFMKAVDIKSEVNKIKSWLK